MKKSIFSLVLVTAVTSATIVSAQNNVDTPAGDVGRAAKQTGPAAQDFRGVSDSAQSGNTVQSAGIERIDGATTNANNWNSRDQNARTMGNRNVNPQSSGWQSSSPVPQVYNNGGTYGAMNGTYASPYGNGGYANGQPMNSGRAHTLRHDASGREFICLNGQRVYFDNAPTMSGQNGAYSAGYGGDDPNMNMNQSNMGNESNQNGVNQNGANQNGANQNGVPQAEPDARTDANIGAADSEVQMETDLQSEPNGGDSD